MLEEIKNYKEIHGHCVVSGKSKTSKCLALWASTQRQQLREMKEGRPSTILQERLDMLNSLGFTWNVREDNWHEMLEDLKEYKERHGDCRVPEIYAPNQQLGNWVMAQRQAYKAKINGKKSAISKNHILLLK
mmetsp:Transcript_5974/g.8849  ORF Transcript_5974/g.8849 Transcript_5974/m.8849 type:complete len:132 (-) Transcript_5974:238-633(-)